GGATTRAPSCRRGSRRLACAATGEVDRRRHPGGRHHHREPKRDEQAEVAPAWHVRWRWWTLAPTRAGVIRRVRGLTRGRIPRLLIAPRIRRRTIPAR